MENRICETCGKEFTPTGPIQRDCKECLTERINMLTKKLVETNKKIDAYNEFAQEFNKKKLSIDFGE